MNDLMSAAVIDALPHIFGRNGPVPASLAGATILRIGTLENRNQIEGGGLVIDYQPTGSPARRIVFAFNDVAMWVEGEADLSNENATTNTRGKNAPEQEIAAHTPDAVAE
jgi:hypothetical protein